jgi:hypothetical protein
MVFPFDGDFSLVIFLVLTLAIYWTALSLIRISRNDWQIDLARWNLLKQFRSGKRDSENGD